MNIIVVTQEERIVYALSHYFFPAGINIVSFPHCTDAIVQLNQVNPQVIIVDTDTEPRAWKPLSTVFNQNKGERSMVFLLIMSDCDLETANQALFLGVNGIILKPFDEKKSVVRIVQLIKRRIEIEKSRSFIRVVPDINDSLLFLYKDLEKKVLFKGMVQNISAIGLSANINIPLNELGYEKGDVWKNCVLKIKGYEIRLEIVIIWQQGKTLGCRFQNINTQEMTPVYEYLLNKLGRIFEITPSNRPKSGNPPVVYESLPDLPPVDEGQLKENVAQIKKFYENRQQS